ncbi:type VII secretion protein EssC [Mammaliicoccus vitulinus]|uniref:Type VII secretion system protein EssC n=1 Tax=Mammaliicoccus vitulinus TaxID=71237 RepID=A0A2T4PQM2_9STAP|nr:type VII secretion protein EssC [Mammaliicoccus vitulinus]PTI28144.1 type VII secretion protein EssC [Mammaliicoccus vitulinus]
MHKLIIKYQKQLKMLNLRDKQTYTISNKETADITFKGLDEAIHIEQNVSGMWQANHTTILQSLVRKSELGDITLMIYASDNTAPYVYPSAQDVMTIGQNDYDDIQVAKLPSVLMFKDINHVRHQRYIRLIHDSSIDVYVNYELQKENTNTLYVGDHLYIEGIWLEIKEEGIVILSHEPVQSHLIQLKRNEPNSEKVDFNEYHRSPRIIQREPTDKIKIEKPPQPIQKNNTMIWRAIIPPLVMIALTVVIFLVRPIGVYILMMVGMSTVTIIFGITTYFTEKKKYKEEVEKRERDYKQYLSDKATEINNAIKDQRYSLNFHYPTLPEIKDIVETKAPRIYEKTSHHHDFLHYKLGVTNIKKSFDFDYQEDEFIQRRDELFDDAKELYEFYQDVEQAPLVNDLTHGPIAYIGSRHLIIEELEKMLLQLATFHSYHDLEFLFVIREEERQSFDWARWLPHMTFQSQNIRGFIYNQRTRDQILTSMYSLIKERIQTVRERSKSNEKIVFTPQLVFVITDMSLIIDHVILEYVNQDLSEYGISLIFVEDVIESLPEHVKTIIDIKSRTEGELVMKEEELTQLKFTPEIVNNFDKEYIARRLANLKHIEHMKNAIPNSITFLQMYNVTEVDELNIEGRWKHNETYKTMAVPLGVRGKDDVLSLNLHEKAHGPHGLIAGTTGSGKSEIIQSYILSLAVNFHPHEVAFLLIDYKGGGMANLFKDLKHLVGTITNLDGDESMRALTSIKAELRKRQRLFGEHDVNHINQYHKLFKEGIATEPMPHLYIVSDEFAELKSEQPDFMKELVSTARIGRSLGIHLILATQKPSGVVDDQIWSNSKFKLALKVQDRQDSNEILKTPDAADITLPGRAYLQVGNNEIYELFQSAWSGATYDTIGDALEVEDKTIYVINDYGQLEAINKDLSGLDDEIPQETQTELEAVIDYIEKVTERLAIENVKRPWLPPLPEAVYQPDLIETDFRKLWSDQPQEVELTVGLKDVPEEQHQGPMTLKLKQAGHIALIGSPGYGRTNFLHNIIFDIARHYRPNQAHMYLFDFGTNGLMPVSDIPHVADYFTVDQEDKIAKAIKKVNQLISERKKLLSQERVINIEQYNKETATTVPNVFIIIDNYDTVKESPFVEAYEEMMAKVTREGLALGVYIVMTGSRSNAIKSAIFTNIKTRIALYLFENNELTNIIGSYKKGVKDIKGRAVINDDNFTQMHIAQPFELKDGETYNSRIKDEIAQMNEHYVGDYPAHIPMMPEKVLLEDVEARYDLTKMISEEHKLPLGLDFEDVELVSLDLSKSSIVTALKPKDQEYLNQIIMRGLTDLNKESVVILIDVDENMSQYAGKVTSYYSKTSELINIRKGFKEEINARKEGRRPISEKKVVFINNVKRFNQSTGMTEDEVRILFNEGSKYNVLVIASGLYSDTIGAFDKESKMMTRTIIQAVIAHKISEQDFLKVKDQFREPELKPYEMFYVNNQEYKKIKLIEE